QTNCKGLSSSSLPLVPSSEAHLRNFLPRNQTFDSKVSVSLTSLPLVLIVSLNHSSIIELIFAQSLVNRREHLLKDQIESVQK
ncbi:hypothetical protein Ccrd_026709, partial [Cynara cardunculus var. scolymus]